jgi:hypothetical protein
VKPIVSWFEGWAGAARSKMASIAKSTACSGAVKSGQLSAREAVESLESAYLLHAGRFDGIGQSPGLRWRLIIVVEGDGRPP